MNKKIIQLSLFVVFLFVIGCKQSGSRSVASIMAGLKEEKLHQGGESSGNDTGGDGLDSGSDDEGDGPSDDSADTSADGLGSDTGDDSGNSTGDDSGSAEPFDVSFEGDALTNDNPISIRVDFSEELINELGASDFVVSSGAEISAVNQLGTQSYEILLTPVLQSGELSVSVSENTIESVSGATNLPAEFVFSFDGIPPVPFVHCVPNAAPGTIATEASCSVDFSGDQIDISKLLVHEAIATTDGVTILPLTIPTISGFTFDVLLSPGSVEIQFLAGFVQDGAGNLNVGSNSYSLENIEDLIAHLHLANGMNSNHPTYVSEDPIRIQATFSQSAEMVKNWPASASDIQVSNGSLVTTFVPQVSPTVFEFFVTPNNQGNVGLTIPAGWVKAEAGGNTNIEANISVVFDSQSPESDLNCSPDGFQGFSSELSCHISFSEPVEQFDPQKIQNQLSGSGQVIYNGPSSGTEFYFTVEGIGTNQTTIVTVPEEAAIDFAGNTVSSVSYSYDNSAVIQEVTKIELDLNSNDLPLEQGDVVFIDIYFDGDVTLQANARLQLDTHRLGSIEGVFAQSVSQQPNGENTIRFRHQISQLEATRRCSPSENVSEICSSNLDGVYNLGLTGTSIQGGPIVNDAGVEVNPTLNGFAMSGANANVLGTSSATDVNLAFWYPKDIASDGTMMALSAGSSSNYHVRVWQKGLDPLDGTYIPKPHENEVNFGKEIELIGNHLVVSSDTWSSISGCGLHPGQVHVYVLFEGEWGTLQKLPMGGDPVAEEYSCHFGQKIAFNGNYIAVSGGVHLHIYKFNPAFNMFQHHQVIDASLHGISDLDMVGNLLVYGVEARKEANVFRINQSSGLFEHEKTLGGGTLPDGFGRKVATNGSQIAVACKAEDDQDSAFLFRKDGDDWLKQTLQFEKGSVFSNSTASAYYDKNFGREIEFRGNVLAIGSGDTGQSLHGAVLYTVDSSGVARLFGPLQSATDEGPVFTPAYLIDIDGQSIQSVYRQNSAGSGRLTMTPF